MRREQALDILNEYISNPNLIKHMLAVEAVMGFYANLHHQDVESWGITGLLHDFDWEIHTSADGHPQKGKPILEKNGVPPQIIRAIQSHADHTGVERVSLMEKTLYACDEITGLVTACVLVRPTRSIFDLKVKSVKKKWKDKAFASGVNREEIQRGVDNLGIELWEHVANVIKAMQGIAKELELDGSG